MNQRTYDERDAVDFVIVGLGAAGGALAKELATNGFDVVVFEAGPWQQPNQFTHDELAEERENAMLNLAFEPFQTIRASEADPAKPNTGRALAYRRGVGGSSVHFAANYWRFRAIDFKERSKWGSISGTGFADWPITYDELEPYYTKVDWTLAVSHVRALLLLRMRVRREIIHARDGHPEGSHYGPVRGSRRVHGVSDRDERWRSCDRCGVSGS